MVYRNSKEQFQALELTKNWYIDTAKDLIVNELSDIISLVRKDKCSEAHKAVAMLCDKMQYYLYVMKIEYMKEEGE
jgi:hypothetical protein